MAFGRDGVWIAAEAFVGADVTAGTYSDCAHGRLPRDLKANTVSVRNPARPIGPRYLTKIGLAHLAKTDRDILISEKRPKLSKRRADGTATPP